MIVFDLPLDVPFRGVTRRRGILIEGPAGWAEWSPFPEYDDAEAGRWLHATLEAATSGHPAALRDRVPINGIVPALPPDEAAGRAVASGCATIKIKVAAPGGGLAADVARVAAVRAALPGAAIRVDANGAWTLSEAIAAAAALSPFGLEYIEQPCRDVADLAELRHRLAGEVAIAADESIRRAEDPLLVRDRGAADVVVLKLQPLGGAGNCLRLAAELGLPVVVSSAMDSAVGLYAGLRLAAALPELPFACGLETARLLAADVASPPRIEDGTMAVGEAPRVDDPPTADPEETRWWLERLHRVTELTGLELP